MSPRVRAMTGAMTTAVFVGIGGSLLAEGQTVLGGVLMALGLLRGVLVVVQFRAPRGSDRE